MGTYAGGCVSCAGGDMGTYAGGIYGGERRMGESLREILGQEGEKER